MPLFNIFKIYQTQKSNFQQIHGLFIQLEYFVPESSGGTGGGQRTRPWSENAGRWEHMGYKGFPEATVSIRLTCPLCFTIAPLGSYPPSPHKTHHSGLPLVCSFQRFWRMLDRTPGWDRLPKAKSYLLLKLRHVWEKKNREEKPHWPQS